MGADEGIEAVGRRDVLVGLRSRSTGGSVAGSRPASRHAASKAVTRSATVVVTPSVAVPASSGNVSHWSA